MTLEIRGRLTGEPSSRRFQLVLAKDLLKIAEQATASLVARVRRGQDAKGVSRTYSTKRIKLKKSKGLGTGTPPIKLRGGTDRGSSREYAGGYQAARVASGLKGEAKNFSATKNLLDKLVPLKTKMRRNSVLIGWRSSKLNRIALGLRDFKEYIAWSPEDEQKAFEVFQQLVLDTLEEQGW